jgi:cytochrome P450
MVNIITIIAAVPIAFAVHKLLTTTVFKTSSPSIPTINLWSALLLDLFQTGKINPFHTVSNTISNNPDYSTRTLLRISLWPFLNFLTLNGPEGSKIFHANRHMNLAHGYNVLLGSYRADEANYAATVLDIKTFIKSAKPENLERYAAHFVIPQVVSFIQQSEVEAQFQQKLSKTVAVGHDAKLDDSTVTVEGNVEDLLESMYDMVLWISSASLCGYTVGKNNAARLDRLKEIMRLTDLENMLKENPLWAIFPNFGPFKKAREARYDQARVFFREVLDDYIKTHQDVLELTGDAKEEYKDHDYCEGVVRDMWNPETKTVDFDGFWGTIHNFVFAAASNQFVAATLYLMYISKDPEELKMVTEELRPLVEYLKDSGVSTKAGVSGENVFERLPMSILDGMPRLEAGVYETLRKTSAGFAPRYVTEDVPLPDGSVIPKNHTITLLHSLMHKSPVSYPEPEKFDPSRYLVPTQDGESIKIINATTSGFFLGFGSGRHPCLGMRFALLQIKLLCALVLANWEIEFPNADMSKLSTMIVGLSRPAPKVSMMKFKRRVEAF